MAVFDSWLLPQGKNHVLSKLVVVVVVVGWIWAKDGTSLRPEDFGMALVTSLPPHDTTEPRTSLSYLRGGPGP